MVIVNGLAAIWFMIGYVLLGIAMIRTAVAMSGPGLVMITQQSPTAGNPIKICIRVARRYHQ